MKIEDICITSDLRHIEKNVRELILGTLKPWGSQIDILAVKLKKAFYAPLNLNGYQCTILLKTFDGKTYRSDSRDSDEMLAIYDALSKIIDESIPKISEGNDRPRRSTKIIKDYKGIDNFISNNVKEAKHA
ncbi:MAG: hypothetical protein ABIE07_14550 [Candidatus Zixiibacteriota bacterium]